MSGLEQGVKAFAGGRAAIAVSGVKNSGKTALIEGILAYLEKRGLKTAVIKHDGHDFEPDVPGTDSYRYQRSGACGAAVFSSRRLMVTKETREPVGAQALAACFPEADLILFEGLKASGYLKLEVVRKGNSAGCVCDGGTLAAVVSDMEAEAFGGAVSGRELLPGTARAVREQAGRIAGMLRSGRCLSGPLLLLDLNDREQAGRFVYELYRRIGQGETERKGKAGPDSCPFNIEE